ncbi:MAG TPA: helix-turn-helix domain-containing protein [Dongiaceae bacterium]
MKVSREEVAENRERILEAAGRLFRKRGFEDVTVAEIMQAARLTHGAFYGYFKSKEELIAESLAAALTPEPGAKPIPLSEYADRYLREGHRDDPESGCLFAALGSEAVRANGDVRHIMTEALQRLIANFSRTAPGKTEAARRRAAIGSWSAMVGAVILARLADDEALSDDILAETRAWIGE